MELAAPPFLLERNLGKALESHSRRHIADSKGKNRLQQIVRKAVLHTLTKRVAVWPPFSCN
jgi:hypothetical protein